MGLSEAVNREAVYIAAVARTLMLTRGVHPDAKRTIADWTERWARERPDSPAILHEDRIVSWGELDTGANRFARWAQATGLRKGDVVTLLMENRPEYVMAWLGLIKSGVIAALVNTHLTGQPLAHSIALAGAKHLILGGELAANYATALGGLDSHPTLWVTGGARAGCENLDAALAAQSGAPMPAGSRSDIFCRDKALYIYTSGTTGPAQGREYQPYAAAAHHERVSGRGECEGGRPHVRRAAALSFGGRHCGARPALSVRRLAGGAQQIFGDRILGRLPPLPDRPCSNISASSAAIFSTRPNIRTSAITNCASPSATACARRSGPNSRRGFEFRTSWNSTARPKAMSA